MVKKAQGRQNALLSKGGYYPNAGLTLESLAGFDWKGWRF